MISINLSAVTAGLAIFSAGTLVGIEFCVGFFVHPELWKLPDRVHASSARSLAIVFGSRMPLWYAVTLLLSVSHAVLLHFNHPKNEGFAWLGSGLWLSSIGFTLLFPLPINRQVASFDLDRLPSNWKTLRRQWDRFHLIRNCIVSAAFICTILSSAT